MRVDGEWALWLLYLDSGEQKRICPADYPGPDWSPDGHTLVYTDGRSLRLMRSDGYNDRPLAGLPGYDPEWSPDGREVVYGTGKSVQSRTIEGEEFRIWSYGDDVFSHPTWSPDGRRVAMMDDKGRLVISDGTTQKAWDAGGASNPEWSPTGSRILMDHPDGTIRAFDAQTGELRPLGVARGKRPSWLRDGTRFLTVWQASGDDAVTVYEWDADGVSGKKLTSRDEVREAAGNW